jgi:flavin-dependent dehydrogenase
MAAREAARGGARVLLVDRVRFPRTKVCGCCLNGAALGILRETGLGGLPQRCGAPALTAFHLACRGRFATVPLTEGVSLSRDRFDAELIDEAITEGVAFLDETQAVIESSETEAASCRVNLKSENGHTSTHAKIVVVAGGLGCRALAETEVDERWTAGSSRVGAGTVLAEAPDEYATGTIYMACHRGGYAGLVRLEDGRLDIAAALDAAAIKQSGGMGNLVAEVLRSSGLPVPTTMAAAKWHGTPRLTQRRQRVYGDRYFVVGDAAGYVEPFTGEGMAWALATGRAVAPLVLESLDAGTHATGPAWERLQRNLVGNRMRMCRIVSQFLRHPLLVRFAVQLLSRVPGLARPVVRALNEPFTTPCRSTRRP